MKNVKLKNFAMGLIVGGALMSASTAMAQSDTVTAFLSNMSFMVNGEKVTISEKPLVKDGTSYVPLRSVATILGYDVDWDAKTKTAIFETKDETSPSNNAEEGSNSSNQEEGGIVTNGLATTYLVDGKIDLDKVKAAIEGKLVGVNDKDKETGQTLLMRAAQDNAYFVLHYLYSKGASVNLQDNEGRTALHYAVIAKSDSAAGELLDAFKAKSRIKDSYGKMPIDYTVKNSSQYRYLDSYSE